jgi:copper chaperone CopZ
MRQLVAIMSVLAIFGTGLLAQKNGDSAPGAVCTLKITGMACSACANTVEKAAKKVPGVTAARANQPSGSAEITFDPAKTSAEAIAKAITAKTPFTAEVDKPK